MSRKPAHREIIPENAVEAHFLKTTNLSNRDNVEIRELHMRSAYRDLGLTELAELGWPTKEVREERKVQHAIPGKSDLQEDVTVRVSRVPMTEAEASQFFMERAQELLKSSQASAPTQKRQAKNKR